MIQSATKRKTTILVVDDQAENVQLMADVLASDGYVTLAAASGPEALDLLTSNQPGAILLDLMMPGMDGYEVLRRVRENPKTTHIPVMVITALLLSDEDRIRIERDAQAIFLKGTFWIEDLLKEVARLVNSPLRTP